MVRKPTDQQWVNHSNVRNSIPDIEDPKNMKRVMDDPECYVPGDIENKELRNKLASSIRKFYFDDKPIAIDNVSNFVDVSIIRAYVGVIGVYFLGHDSFGFFLCQLYTDNFFLAGIMRATKLHVQLAEHPVYFFVFSYDGGMNLVKFFVNIDRSGKQSFHGTCRS